jgi:hypothetical protein
MTVVLIVIAVVLLLILLTIALQLPEIRRYMKIKSM